MSEDILQSSRDRMQKSVDSLGEELKRVRTGRAQVSMLDPIMVEYYGNPTPLNQVAAISCPDAKSFMIAPWEANVLKDIEQAIVRSDLGMSPMNDGKVIRLKVPELTEERRKDLVRQVKKTVEDGRVGVRMARRDGNEALKKLLKDKEISEDDNKSWSEKIQKATDEYISKIDAIAEEKEKELMTV